MTTLVSENDGYANLTDKRGPEREEKLAKNIGQFKIGVEADTGIPF